MRNLKLIDNKKIGNLEFNAYITEDENELKAFAIYFQNTLEPLLLFEQDATNNIEIKINEKLVNTLQQLKSKDDKQRKIHYKVFQEFVLEAQQEAKELIFKDKKIKYITDVKLIKNIEKAYLLN